MAKKKKGPEEPASVGIDYKPKTLLRIEGDEMKRLKVTPAEYPTGLKVSFSGSGKVVSVSDRLDEFDNKRRQSMEIEVEGLKLVDKDGFDKSFKEATEK